jgi:hypothetical protein
MLLSFKKTSIGNFNFNAKRYTNFPIVHIMKIESCTREKLIVERTKLATMKN